MTTPGSLSNSRFIANHGVQQPTHWGTREGRTIKTSCGRYLAASKVTEVRWDVDCEACLKAELAKQST